MRHELFSHSTQEVQTHTPKRPLGSVSNYVCEEMSDRLVAVQQNSFPVFEYILEVDRVLEVLPQILIPLQHNESELLLARLDLLFLEHSIVHSGGNSPIKLKNLVEEIAKATSRPPGITYEDLIFINPQNDMRHFTTGKVGLAETDFYRGHQYIEEQLLSAISLAFILVENTKFLPEDILNMLMQIAYHIETATNYMSSFGNSLSTEDFHTFARFHNKNPNRPETKSAGGQFSSSIPILDVLLAGEQVPKHIIEHWINTLSFFPVYGQAEFLYALQLLTEAKTIKQIVGKMQNESITNAFEKIDQIIRSFRARHYKAVSTHLSEDLNNGSKLQEFLKERIQISHQ